MLLWEIKVSRLRNISFSFPPANEIITAFCILGNYFLIMGAASAIYIISLKQKRLDEKTQAGSSGELLLSCQGTACSMTDSCIPKALLLWIRDVPSMGCSSLSALRIPRVLRTSSFLIWQFLMLKDLGGWP